MAHIGDAKEHGSNREYIGVYRIYYLLGLYGSFPKQGP